MGALTGKSLSSTYKSIIKVSDETNGISATARNVEDGEGTNSSILLSTKVLYVVPQVDAVDTFIVSDKDANALLKVDSTNDVVRAGIGQHYVNTNIKDWYVFSGTAYPSTADTWTCLGMGGGGRTLPLVTMGTGSAPQTTYTISTTADDLVGMFWYVPFNITIDSCHVWVASSGATGDVVKFSIMDYAINRLNGSEGGDLASGVETCVSPATITSAGYEQAYYQSLTVSSANVDAGRAILACVAQDGTNSDLSVQLQLVYHMR